MKINPRIYHRNPLFKTNIRPFYVNLMIFLVLSNFLRHFSILGLTLDQMTSYSGFFYINEFFAHPQASVHVIMRICVGERHLCGSTSL